MRLSFQLRQSRIIKNLVLGLFFWMLAGCRNPTLEIPDDTQPLPPQSAIASAHPLATEAGIEILAQGGNAFDAGIAVAAVLGVVEPYSAGLGGGGFWLIQPVGKQAIMIDARETAPIHLTVDHFHDTEGFSRDKAINGPLSAGIPGQPAALAHLASQYGKLPLEKSLARAIEHARKGFETNPVYDRLIKWRKPVITRYPSAQHLLPSSFTMKTQKAAPSRIIQTDLAHTLTRLAEQGHAGFYKGEIAKQLVNSVRSAGGVWTLEDLGQYRIIEREPIVGTFRGVKITTAAPPSAGGVLLVNMLNMLEPYELSSLEEVQRTHLIVEVMRRAYAERAQHLGDPDFYPVPVEKLTSKTYAKQQMKNFQWKQATPSESVISKPESLHTTHFSILDQEGNRLSATLSINLPFGSGFVAQGTGVLLNNELDDFSLDQQGENAYSLTASQANALAPRKRPLSSMTPTFLEHEDWLGIVGTPGGSRITTMVLLASLEAVQGHLPSQWVQLPRFHHQYLPNKIEFEKDTLDQSTKVGLQALGHSIEELNRAYGDMQAVLWRKHQSNKHSVFAASDPRRIGQAQVTNIAGPKKE